MFWAETRLDRERRTVEAMIRVYCRKRHGGDKLCGECSGLWDYAQMRLQRCPFQENKPVCAKCPIHCYQPKLREQMREVMRYAGPRMLLRHPVLTIRHMMDSYVAAPKAKPPAGCNRS